MHSAERALINICLGTRVIQHVADAEKRVPDATHRRDAQVLRRLILDRSVEHRHDQKDRLDRDRRVPLATRGRRRCHGSLSHFRGVNSWVLHSIGMRTLCKTQHDSKTSNAKHAAALCESRAKRITAKLPAALLEREATF